jgi:hypothetical protein
MAALVTAQAQKREALLTGVHQIGDKRTVFPGRVVETERVRGLKNGFTGQPVVTKEYGLGSDRIRSIQDILGGYFVRKLGGVGN